LSQPAMSPALACVSHGQLQHALNTCPLWLRAVGAKSKKQGAAAGPSATPAAAGGDGKDDEWGWDDAKAARASAAARKAAGAGAGSPGGGGGLLFQIHWHRVVLDEAQSIKNPRTLAAHAAWRLAAAHRWCLSGTPIQNSVDDLYSYFKFLRYKPYSHHHSFKELIKDRIALNPEKGYQVLKVVLQVRVWDPGVACWSMC
jgi:hypothetical protein